MEVAIISSLEELAHVELAILRLRLRPGDVLRRTTSWNCFWERTVGVWFFVSNKTLITKKVN